MNLRARLAKLERQRPRRRYPAVAPFDPSDPAWLGAYLEAMQRVQYGHPTADPDNAPPARPVLLSLAPDDGAADVPA